MTTVARLLRGLLPVLAAAAAGVATALPAASQPVTRADQWWLAALHLPAALTGAPAAGRGVTVAVLSTGVDARHPDLAGRVTAGPDLGQTGRRAGGPYWGDEGTAVASLIAGHGHGRGGGEGITGVAPGARILSVPVTLEYNDPLNADAAVTRRLPAAIAAGIRYAVGHGATVIALPLDPGTLGPAVAGDPGAAGGSAAERAAVSFALGHGVLLIAPAGDNGGGTDAVNYPAAYPGVIAVGATARNGQLASFTPARSYVALTAPGSGGTLAAGDPGGTPAGLGSSGLAVAAPDGGYQSLASSDMSAALTAGVAALVRSRYPRLTVPQVTQALERGVTAPGSGTARPAGNGRGHGELDAATALTAAAAIAAAHPAPAPSPSSAASVPPSASPAQSVFTGPTLRPAPRPPDPGHLLRSLVTGLAVAAGVLILGLAGAITLIRLRRRRRSDARRLAAARSGSGASPGRHSRERAITPGATGATGAHGAFTRPATAATRRISAEPAAPVSPWAPAAPEASGAPAVSGSAWEPAAPAPAWAPAVSAPAENLSWPEPLWTQDTEPPWTQDTEPPWAQDGDSAWSQSKEGAWARDEGPAWSQSEDSPWSQDEGPTWSQSEEETWAPGRQGPWPSASAPGRRVPPDTFLSAAPDLTADGPRAPWERSPGAFGTAPPGSGPEPWPVTSTGPMYVWNPAAATAPLRLAGDDESGGNDRTADETAGEDEDEA